MDMLRRSYAPISAEGWAQIDEMARQVLTANLSARRFVDVNGPHGINYPCVPLGRLEVPKKQKADGVCYGIHQVLPLVETRISFALGQWELDNLGRGAKDIQLETLVKAAKQMAAFEETAIYSGFAPSGIQGLHAGIQGPALKMAMDEHGVIDAISEAQGRLAAAGVDGAAALAVSPQLWKFMARNTQGGTLRQIVQNQIGGPVVYSAAVKGALLAATRGGDLELTLGQDLAIGYANHDSREIQLYMTESFTFRVITPEAAVSFSII